MLQLCGKACAATMYQHSSAHQSSMTCMQVEGKVLLSVQCCCM